MSYLGLEEIYLPFYALFPKYATRKQKEIREAQRPATGLSPSLAPISTPLDYPQQLAEETLLICVWAHEEHMLV
jgi:hypothetical protein